MQSQVFLGAMLNYAVAAGASAGVPISAIDCIDPVDCGMRFSGQKSLDAEGDIDRGFSCPAQRVLAEHRPGR